MHGMHARLPKNFVLEERLERYGAVIEADPYTWRGRWVCACAPVDGAAFREVRLDLGCGKGSFTVEAARREPDVLFIGMDSEPVCIAYAAQRGCESGLSNVVFVPGTGMRIKEMFGPAELGRIYLNFPTPFPRKRESHLRLVNMERLLDYREVLALAPRFVCAPTACPCASLPRPSCRWPATKRPGKATTHAASIPTTPPASTRFAWGRRAPRSSRCIRGPRVRRLKIPCRLPR